MRESNKPASLNELLGGKGEKEHFELDDLKEILGENMPDLSFDRVGRLRLVQALQQRFGVGFRRMKALKNLIHEFDEEMKVATITKRNKGN
jgi:hypothetical protein